MNSLSTYLRRIVYLFLGMCNLLFPSEKKQIVILCYHSIGNDGWRFSVTPESFKKQIEYLSTKFQFITLTDVYNHCTGHKKIQTPSVVINFDDGYKNILSTRDILNSFNIKPTVFLISDAHNANRKELETSLELLNHNDIKELIHDGWEIGCHTGTHPDLLKLNDLQIQKEVVQSKSDLEKEFHIHVQSIAYPKGKYSDQILNYVQKAGFKLGLTMDDEFITSQTQIIAIPRVGVDGSHSFAEFKVLFTPLAITFRKFVKKLI